MANSSTLATAAPLSESDGAHTLSAREKAAIVHHLRTLMEYWSITPEELEAPAPYRRPPPPSALTAVKYRHPASGDTWNGDGDHPQWLRDALLKEGYTVEELRPQADPA